MHGNQGSSTATPAPPLVLASASAIRRKLLEAAGLSPTVVAVPVDEGSVKNRMRAQGTAVAEVAAALAQAKARPVSMRYPGSLVIGADQMLEADGNWFDKPGDRAAARAQLQALRGRTHELVSAVCVMRDQSVTWHHVSRARLTMRNFSDAFLDAYLDAVGAQVCDSVGAYQLEDRGVQLFEKVEGDYFTILGLPLLPLLDHLRSQGAMPT